MNGTKEKNNNKKEKEEDKGPKEDEAKTSHFAKEVDDHLSPFGEW